MLLAWFPFRSAAARLVVTFSVHVAGLALVGDCLNLGTTGLGSAVMAAF